LVSRRLVSWAIIHEVYTERDRCGVLRHGVESLQTTLAASDELYQGVIDPSEAMFRGLRRCMPAVTTLMLVSEGISNVRKVSPDDAGDRVR
jgi:hypothetical protein